MSTLPLSYKIIVLNQIVYFLLKFLFKKNHVRFYRVDCGFGLNDGERAGPLENFRLKYILWVPAGKPSRVSGPKGANKKLVSVSHVYLNIIFTSGIYFTQSGERKRERFIRVRLHHHGI